MPVTGPTSYVPTTQAFINHWTEVNAALPTLQPLTLPNPDSNPAVIVTLANFTTARGVLLDQRDVIEELDFELSFARATLDLTRAKLHAWMNLFNDKVRGGLAGTAYERTLADVPGVDAGLEAFSKPIKRTKALWIKLENDQPSGITQPVVLQDGTPIDTFTDAVTALGQAFDAVTAAETLVTLGIEKRNDLQAPLYAAMKAYRLAVPGRLMPDNALVESMPGLTVEGGRTPDPVSLAGEWSAATSKAKLTVGASDDPELKGYEVRYCVGPDYTQDREHVAGIISGAGPLIFETIKGVGSPGAVGSYRVYVILNSGHEAGSNTAVVARPAG